MKKIILKKPNPIKPRNPMAREVLTNPQFKPKVVQSKTAYSRKKKTEIENDGK